MWYSWSSCRVIMQQWQCQFQHIPLPSDPETALWTKHRNACQLLYLINHISHFYCPQTKFAKVMFLQVSVCPHWGCVCGFIWWGACVVLFRGCVVLFRGCAWFYSGGHAWFYLGGRAWFFQFFWIQWDTVNERVVRILLECILVRFISCFFLYSSPQAYSKKQICGYELKQRIL